MGRAMEERENRNQRGWKNHRKTHSESNRQPEQKDRERNPGFQKRRNDSRDSERPPREHRSHKRCGHDPDRTPAELRGPEPDSQHCKEMIDSRERMDDPMPETTGGQMTRVSERTGGGKKKQNRNAGNFFHDRRNMPASPLFGKPDVLFPFARSGRSGVKRQSRFLRRARHFPVRCQQNKIGCFAKQQIEKKKMSGIRGPQTDGAIERAQRIQLVGVKINPGHLGTQFVPVFPCRSFCFAAGSAKGFGCGADELFGGGVVPDIG